MATHNDFGNEAEEKAAQYLNQKGFKILKRNYRAGKAEVDIIAFDEPNQILIVVEVKARTSNHISEPENSVNFSKKKFLIQAADEFLSANNLNLEVRFDIISIIKSGSDWKIKHIQNAFHPYE